MESINNKNDSIEQYINILHFFTKGSDDCFFIWEIAERKIYFSKNIANKYDFLDIKNNTCDIDVLISRLYSRDVEIFYEEMEKIIKKEKDVYELSYRVLSKNNCIVWVHTRGKVQYDENGNPARLIGQVSDHLTKYKIDILTGAFNISQLIEDVNYISEKFDSIYLLAIGVDDMKHINIKHGREYGDNILRKLVQVFENNVNDYHHRIYRISGDSFAAILRDIDKDDIEKIYKGVCESFSGDCTLSAGAVEYDKNIILDANTLYQCVEMALDYAKVQGKNRLNFFKETDYQSRLSNIKLQDSLRKSINNNFDNFSVHYQPQINMENYTLYGAEALLRYNDKDRGNVPPTEFIPILEKTDMISQVGMWVLKQSLKQCKKWRDILPDFHISVNLSYSQLKNPDITQQVLDALYEEGLTGDALTLEVTESMQLHNYHKLNSIFSCWKNAGIEISVDDFGTGYSSLNRLQNLDIDEIKIDRCFITEIQNSMYNYQLVNNVIKLADNRNMRVCCEGVENLDELMVLEKLEPQLIQGYLFGKPLMASEFEEKFIKNSKITHIQKKKRDKISQKKQAGHYTREQLLEYILDSLDECIYICDMETYEVYYMNRAHKKLIGIDEYEHKKCYQLVHNKNAPCAFCTRWELKEKDSGSWNTYNHDMEDDVIIKDRIIDWNGRDAKLQIIMKTNNQ